MSNECLVKNVFESNGTSMLDGCGIGRPIPTNWCVFFISSKTTWPTMLMTCIQPIDNEYNKIINKLVNVSSVDCLDRTRSDIQCWLACICSYLEWSAFDVDTSSATRQRTLDANHNIAMAFLFAILWLMAIAQQVTQFTVIALMCIVPHLLAHYVNLPATNTKTIFMLFTYLLATTTRTRLTNCISIIIEFIELPVEFQ